ncbi:MAG: hypothetical protein LC623_05900, partial [Halobacteriales archaeon]|nr:hypothetical protein [Halobacteriales archaeon]
MKPLIPSFLLLAASLAGCSHPAPPTGAPCGNDYTLGCDGNPDAQYFLTHYGLHQFTNSTYYFRSLSMKDGLIEWQNEKPPYDHFEFRGYMTGESKFLNHTIDQSKGGGYPQFFGPQLFYSVTPFAGGPRGVGKADYFNTTFYVGDMLTNERREVNANLHGVFKAEGFDGKWALLGNQRLKEKVQDDFLALNTQTGQVITLYQG